MDIQAVLIIKMAVCAGLAYLSLRKSRQIGRDRERKRHARLEPKIKVPLVQAHDQKKSDTQLSTSAVSVRTFQLTDARQNYLTAIAGSIYEEDSQQEQEKRQKSERGSCIEAVMKMEGEEQGKLQVRSQQIKINHDQSQPQQESPPGRYQSSRRYNFNNFLSHPRRVAGTQKKKKKIFKSTL